MSKNIRILREAGGLGDVIRMFPTLEGIKRKYPEHKIYFFCLTEYRNLMKRCKGIDVYISINPRRRRARLSPIDDRKHSYLNISVPFDFDIDLYCPAIQHEFTTQGQCYKDRVELWAESAGLRPGQYDPCPHYPLTQEEKNFGKRWLKSMNCDAERVIGIQPFSTHKLRNWNEKKWIKLIQMLEGKFGYKVILFDSFPGRTRDFPCRKEIARPFPELMAILSNIKFLISPDSGLYHLAGAVDTPALGLFGMTNGKLMERPYKHHISITSKIVQNKDELLPGCKPPCYARRQSGYQEVCVQYGCKCIQRITVPDVLEAITHWEGTSLIPHHDSEMIL